MIASILFDINSLILNSTVKTETFTITNDNVKRESFYTDNFIHYAGMIETQYTPSNAFAFFEYEILEERQSTSAIKDALIVKGQLTQQYLTSFLTFLWFVKDNSVSVDSVISQVYDINECFVKSRCHYFPTNAQAERSETTFSREEILRAHSILIKFGDICPPKTVSFNNNVQWATNSEDKKIYGIEGYSKNFLYSQYNCLERAILFLRTARNVGYPVFKISFYIPILECLFNNGRYKISQLVSNNIAFYLGGNNEERTKIYDVVKEAYDIRSIFFHGRKFKQEHIEIEHLKNLSTDLDEIIRQALLKIIMRDSEIFLVDEERDVYLKKIISQ